MPKTLVFISLLLMVAWSSVGVTPPNLDRALEDQLQMAQDKPSDPAVLNDLGNLLLLAGRATEAETVYAQAVELAPFDFEIRFNYALLLQQSGRDEEAAGHYQQVLEIAPRHAWAHYQLGVIAEASGHRGKALELYAQAFALDSSLTFASNNPHIIDNPLATEALLMSSRYRDLPGSKVPRYYDDADRIRKVMVHGDREEPASAPEIQPEAKAEADVGVAAGGGRGRAVRQAGSEEGVDDPPPPAGVREDEPAKPPRAAGGNPRPAGSNNRRGATYIPGATRAGDTPPNAPSKEGTAWGGADGSNREGSAEADGARQPPNRVNRPPRRAGYRPPVRSTGRLELELLPADGQVAPTVRAR